MAAEAWMVVGAVVGTVAGVLAQRALDAWRDARHVREQHEAETVAELAAEVRELAATFYEVQIQGTRTAQDAASAAHDLALVVAELRDRIAGLEGLVRGLMARFGIGHPPDDERG